MSITESTTECVITKIDQQGGPGAGYWITARTTGTSAVLDSTTNLGGGPQTEITFWMSAIGTPAVGDLIDFHVVAS